MLPEKSLMVLDHFQAAYYTRLKMEGKSSEVPSLLKHFEQWLYGRFSMRPGPHGVFQIVRSYSSGEEDALDRFFKLFSEFEKSGISREPAYEKSFQEIPKLDLGPLIRQIRKNPVLYIGYAHFAGLNAHLMGHQQAGKDMGLPSTADEKLFDQFKKWVEETKSQGATSRPWFKIVSFYSLGDCGHGEGGAYTVFLRWLDEFAGEVGKTDVFRAA